MKQHDTHNDEALYQQMLAELTPGAEKYDELIAEGKHPAAKVRHTIPYYMYAVAASVVLVIGVAILLRLLTSSDAPLQMREGAKKDYYMVKTKVTETHFEVSDESLTALQKGANVSTPCNDNMVQEKQELKSEDALVPTTVSDVAEVCVQTVDTIIKAEGNEQLDIIQYANDSQLDERAVQLRDRVRSHALAMIQDYNP